MRVNKRGYVISRCVEVGQRFGLLVAKGYADNPKNPLRKSLRVIVLCDCGTTKAIPQSQLRSGMYFRCGMRCLIRARSKQRTHGMSKTKIYKVWSEMKRRCNNPADPKYYAYGARGIRVCDRWSSSFENFIEDMGPRPSPQHSIDRVDVNGNYEPSNCRWATMQEQANNKQNTKLIDVGGVSKSGLAWDREMGYPAGTVTGRLHRGWSPVDSVLRPRRAW